MTVGHVDVLALAQRLAAAPERPGGEAAEAVSMPVIRQWCAAMGDRNPCYTDAATAVGSVHDGPVAPPAMVQVWTMPGLDGRAGGTPADEVLSALRASGYTGVVATNCEQDYDRYLRPGELPRTTTRLGAVTGPKLTALGDGYFITWHTTWYSGEQRVARMTFRLLQFRPADPAASPPESASAQGPYPLRPAINADTAFFWAGAKAGELRIQRCGGCGKLRHPPGPMCAHCHSAAHDYVVASGRGEIFTYVVHHHPPVPGKKTPFAVAVIQLPEGVRVTGNVLAVPPDQLRIGMPVEVTYERADDDLVLPQWKPTRDGADVLPELAVPLTTTMVVTTAIATRDFTPVHHDRAAARAQGAPDIFLNILTTMGLVQRFVTDWAGPGAIVRSIAVRLGAPAYAGDTLTLAGWVTDRGADGSVAIGVRGVCGLGDHVTGAVRLDLPGGGGRLAERSAPR